MTKVISEHSIPKKLIMPLPAKVDRFLIRPPWCDMHGISRYCYNVLEVLSVELRPHNPGLGQGLKVIYFKPQNRRTRNRRISK